MPQMTIQQAIELARQRQREGDVREAESIFRQVLTHDPNQIDALHLLGVMLFGEGNAPQAAELIGKAVEVAPQIAEFHNNLGVVFGSLGRTEEAETEFRAAVAIQPDYAEALNNLGAILGDKGALSEAIAFNQRAAELRPGFADTYANLGNAFMRQGRLAEAIAAFDEGLKSAPDALTLNANRLICLNYLTDRSPREVFDEHAKWGGRLCELAGTERTHRNSRDPERRLRVGYVSQDFRAHSVCYFILHALKHHDRDKVDVFCYADVSKPDNMTELARRHANVWRPVPGTPAPQLVEIIQKDEIDILVDLGGYTAPAALAMFAMKPAPVQVTYLGYPHTTGMPRMDYRVTDSLADPPGAADEMTSEKIVRLDPCAWCYHPSPHAPPVEPRNAGEPITFGTFNAVAKINEPLVALWAKLLHANPGARMYLKAGGFAEEAGCRRVGEMFARQGIDHSRIRMTGQVLSPALHLGMYQPIDIALDTFPYHGTTTTCEALWMGVPVIALAGQTHASRVGVSLLTNCGLTDLIAASEERYIDLATRLAADRERLNHLRQSLRPTLQNSPLGDGKAFARRLEDAYRTMWRAWCANF
jgi:predicted O-linked N-acetylglucosamine transferase (SPINDLY family)